MVAQNGEKDIHRGEQFLFGDNGIYATVFFLCNSVFRPGPQIAYPPDADALALRPDQIIPSEGSPVGVVEELGSRRPVEILLQGDAHIVASVVVEVGHHRERQRGCVVLGDHEVVGHNLAVCHQSRRSEHAITLGEIEPPFPRAHQQDVFLPVSVEISATEPVT